MMASIGKSKLIADKKRYVCGCVGRSHTISPDSTHTVRPQYVWGTKSPYPTERNVMATRYSELSKLASKVSCQLKEQRFYGLRAGKHDIPSINIIHIYL